MATAVKGKKKVSSSTNSWKEAPIKKRFSADDLIDAYFRGREDEVADREKILMEKLVANLDKAKEISEDFFKYLIEKKYSCKYLKLRATDVTHFDAIFVIEQKDYIKESFKRVYAKSRKVKENINGDTFCYSFSFMPFSKYISEDEFLSDGYFLDYGKNHKS
ncbi:hypothetical protein GF354_01945 [Candidatus Peregrinibacteria bacterium]|nr:hypothetical protein [Candidatus Peregrinibacteria bacterium]